MNIFVFVNRADGFTPPHGAVMKNHPDVVETLITAGADVNASAIGMNLATPLYMALGNTKVTTICDTYLLFTLFLLI